MSLTTTNATDTAASAAMIADLRTSLRGSVIDRGDPEYDEARQVWNGLIDRHPLAIARCAGTADVVQAVRVARDYRPPVSIRGGGHQVAGSAVCDDGVVIDLSAMKGIHVDPDAATVRAEAGVTWGELDRETQLFGLATPGGEVSATGVAGLTLGGGLGNLMRAYGLSCDNVRSLEIVTADGIVRTASRDVHPDLFWAACGGGRGLGVVTSFEFALHAVGPDVATAQVVYDYADAPQVLRKWRDYAEHAPDSVSPELALWSLPADPELPVELHGRKVVMALAVHAGSPDDADTLEPLRHLASPLLDLSGTVPYVEIQSGSDAMFPDGGRYYMKSHFLDGFTDDAIEAVLDVDAERPTPESLVVIRTLGGAIERAADTAYPHRSARFNLSFDASWFDPALDDQAIGWARNAWAATRPFANGHVYVNFSGLDEDAGELGDAILGSSRRRVDRIRREYDPEGVFADAARRP